MYKNCVSVDSITITGQDPGFSNSFGYINVSPLSLHIAAAMPTDATGYICQGEFHLLTLKRRACM